MTPLEIADYKMRWMRDNPHSVRLHSDLTDKGKTWCRRHLERHQWKMNTWTNVYEHTFYFESKEQANLFEQQWPKFTNQ
jgi:hypothetical protein|tara:strand:- start:72 stop:308 length:237 start_codon:yes stop_codon:yes gene_type:complete